MSNARTYYDSLIQQGYTAEQASQYTKQYYPEFSINATPVMPQPAQFTQPITSPIPTQNLTQDSMVDSKKSKTTIIIASVVVALIIAASAFFLLASDEDSEPSFVGTKYWTATGFGLQYNSDSVYYVAPTNNSNCDEINDSFSTSGWVFEQKGDYCQYEYPVDSYDIKTKGDSYEICIGITYGNNSNVNCVEVFDTDSALYYIDGDNCSVLLTTDKAPDLSLIYSYNWTSTFEPMALEIANNDAPDVCKAFPDLEDSEEQ